MLEYLRLLLQLRIDLFEFGLLHLEVRLRFSQRTSLLFEFLVADAQFLRAGLQFFRLLLSFLQQLFEPLAILGGAHGNGDRFGDARQQFALIRIGGAEEPEFHHACTTPSMLAGTTTSSLGVPLPMTEEIGK